ncbi:P-loop containing nucleoside triphosphate hydrolase protein [Lipomyces kononenkoae]|uniref:P-loop containing nucleoside triphosphate hydrolase protein n=1 Tax=Lipomyces kononenkoae TaxID=34357 RepID=A0ACC3T5E4_LIPKO
MVTSISSSGAAEIPYSSSSPLAKSRGDNSSSEPLVHRLPSQSLLSYLQRLDAAESNFSTRLPSLDMIMRGGVTRGKVTELSGPPGSGKTSIALQVASSAIQSQAKVLWIDTASKIPASRLLRSLPPSISRDDLNDRVAHLQLASFASLLALFVCPPAYLSSYALIVIDDLSTLTAPAFAAVGYAAPQPAPPPLQHPQFDQAFPSDASQQAFAYETPKRQKQEDPGTKRSRVITELVARMAQVAERSNAAVLVLTRMVSRIGGGDARMVSSLGEGQHLAGLWTRLFLFRNDVALAVPSKMPGRRPSRTIMVRAVPHACAVKCAGVNYEDAPSVGVFRIVQDGIVETREWFEDLTTRCASQESDVASRSPQWQQVNAKKRWTVDDSDQCGKDNDDFLRSDFQATIPATGEVDGPSQKKIKPMVVYDIEELEDEDFEIDENDLL